ncbi:MAG: hypothetical protein ABI681_12155 [Gemmatimonadales bacterium]
MRLNVFSLAAVVAAGGSPLLLGAGRAESRVVRVTDTVYVRVSPGPLDYDEVARRVAYRMSQNDGQPTVIDGDLIVKGRLGVGGAPEPGTDYGVTIRAPNTAALRFISNEALRDPQRTANQHRHTGALSLAQDGGLRLDQNSTCFTDERGCTTEDRQRRRAYSGFDSMGDMSFYLSDVDSLTGQPTAPRAQSLVFRLIDWDGNIHLQARRPGQRVYFNGSTAVNASDLQWEVPLR